MKNRWDDGPSFRKAATVTVVVGGHVLLLFLISNTDLRRQTGETERRMVMVVFEEPEAVELPALEEPAPARTKSPRIRDEKETDTSIAIPVETPKKRSAVDWQREMEDAARRAIEGDSRPRPQAFGEMPASPYGKCRWRKPDFEWDPEPSKAGFAGGLPFVLVGERCIVGLGFFGCAIGDLPKPNSRLFEKMDDPDRYVTSVPDVSDCAPPPGSRVP